VKVGIVGLPNAGKSTLFNALTRAGAETAVYPFTTVDPNVAVVEVPDERLDAVVEVVGASPVVRETIEFHDIAGLVRGAAEGEGLGNQFLAGIRETDAICHIVRAHTDEGVPHPEGRISKPWRRSLCSPTSGRPRAGWRGSSSRPRRATPKRTPNASGSSA
jgi:ribosome-binding ATPase